MRRKFWDRGQLSAINDTATFNKAAAHAAGFTFDPGRSLSPDEVSNLNLTPPEKIHETKGPVYWTLNGGKE